jgi:hypothetical protein
MARGFVPDVELDASAGTAALTIRGHWEVHGETRAPRFFPAPKCRALAGASARQTGVQTNARFPYSCLVGCDCAGAAALLICKHVAVAQ